ncbi:MAG: UvrD-helicase domain-containing protein [Myxococcota bacterium]
MSFVADLHIHSKYSRATSKQCDVEPLAWWARRKGIAVVGTGDFTHPAWRAELKDKLVPAEPGLFRLRDDLQREVDRTLPSSCAGPVRFMLSVEISNIYKRHDRVRKVHNIVYVPDFAHADALVERLARIGNLHSDGRPILGLDSHDLLETVLEVGGGSFLVPAHIWTPWFSIFGAKSGFDTVEECFGELSSHIFALETGLSSDPAMNWQLSRLDRYTLVSNSDAHSPHKLGREANLFECDLDYFAMLRALQTGEAFGGTVEFFPEEGKYHLDGCRKCGVRLNPEATQKTDGRCPECNKIITVGVLSRVVELADRPRGCEPDGRKPFFSLVPLPEVISETVGVGPGSKRVRAVYDRLVDRVGPELYVLQSAPLEEISNTSGDMLAEGIKRMRAGEVICEAGYDGEYGVIRCFTEAERRRDRTSGVLFAAPAPDVEPSKARPNATPAIEKRAIPARQRLASPEESPRDSEVSLDPDQMRAVAELDGPLLIVAGPGTGKTRTLTQRIARLVGDRGVAPESCLAITFTRRAAEEMRQRLVALLPEVGGRIPVTTFHGLGASMLKEFGGRIGLPPDVGVMLPEDRVSMLREGLEVTSMRARKLVDRISVCKMRGVSPEPDLARAMELHESGLRERGRVDFDDLLLMAVRLLESEPDTAATLRRRFQWISIDEYQDIDAVQYRLVRLIAPPTGNVCAIGDPDQAIYGFRGADVRFFLRFGEDFPGAKQVRLSRNYRSADSIVKACLQIMAPSTLVPGRRLDAVLDDPSRILIHHAATDKAEAEFVAHGIEQTIGGYGFFSVDSGRVDAGDVTSCGFSDVAVLYRSAAQLPCLEEALHRAGIPYQSRGLGPLGDQVDVARLMDPAAAKIDTWDPRADRVSLLTLHAAKGLEFEVVYVVGCEDGVLPLSWPGSDTDVDEERRLFFVGMTRAKRRLVLTHAKTRRHRGKLRDMEPSPFLVQIEEDLVERSATRKRKAAAAKDSQLTLL